jgi:hypothetical protein
MLRASKLGGDPLHPDRLHLIEAEFFTPAVGTPTYKYLQGLDWFARRVLLNLLLLGVRMGVVGGG